VLSEDLRGSLSRARDAEQAGVALKAIGNMGDPELADAITPYVDDESTYVRASAVWALERVRATEEADGLVARLGTEESGTVRAAIVSAVHGLGDARPASLEAVAELVLREPDSAARFKMVRYLADNLDTYPEAREPLTLLALDDSSSQVRRHAAAALSGGARD
jgi:HEAT repeat protein